MIVRLRISNPDFPALSAGQDYFVIGIEADHYRILNDEGKPYLYPPGLFDLIDTDRPVDWISEYGEDGEEYSYPPLLNGVGFFEDYFDQKPEQVAMFWHALNLTLAKAA
ncbi:hypothetical protein [uncultured Thiodictyon sp.]|uniref:hypothetical protein n=1 Tax=uncultured Thiodictyon sp. TaxID=1846217 RepID=UPI0025D9A502|nr:hypothetical protein [uncultured Thiodictyon sp.]